MAINSNDGTLVCLNIMGVGLFISYLVFAYLVTHPGDFYHIRRWKAALWASSIFGVVLAAFHLIPAVVSSLPGKTVFELISLISGALFPILVFIFPFVFMVTIGMHYQLKCWLNSDDYLDKIWKDPNKGHKSPIQEL